MKHGASVLALLSALVAGACSSGGGGGLANFNTPAVYEGPGCYDHKNRIERSITTKAECDAVTWVWKP